MAAVADERLVLYVLAQVGEALGCVLAHADQQAEAALAVRLYQGLVNEVLYEVDRPVAAGIPAQHRLGCLQIESGLEGGQAGEREAAAVVQQVPRPVQGRAQGGLPSACS